MEDNNNKNDYDDYALYGIILWKPVIMIVMGILIWIIKLIYNIFNLIISWIENIL